jgi:hypothetical protein
MGSERNEELSVLAGRGEDPPFLSHLPCISLMASNKIDPVTAVQDSIDSLALSLFEALRGVRDAVAPESLSAAAPVQNKEEAEPITSENARGELKQILAEGTEISHEYLNRAFDMLEPDYHAFVLSHLSGNEYAKELVERFREIEAAKVAAASLPAKDTTTIAEKGVAIKDKPPSAEPEIGFVGYKFRKLFDAGWFDGKVIEIRPLARESSCSITQSVCYLLSTRD